ncbi:O-antigen ligase family protein [Chthonobacter albigriseus]|uniref:O-antigen ligase family protein n=1 Tax=Chthonobacter albigriseus TaxID=1683161 RepID=UPI0015EE6008|nr:O-antigen ligase family protein [Chthonobacter albigriseus]
MTAFTATTTLQPRRLTLPVCRLKDGSLWLAVFIGGFVMFEPAPYEVFLALAIPLFLVGGLQIRGAFGPLAVCMLVYAAGGALSLTQIPSSRLADGAIYMAVSLFLGLSSIWYAALLAEDWRRIRVIESAYIAIAVLVSGVAVLAYFRLVPGADLFLRYGRAQGTFQDPNVFGPFLILPALLIARRVMTGHFRDNKLGLIFFLVLALGILLSFSRAAWGMLAFGLPLVAALVSATARTNRARLRLLAIAVLGIFGLVVLVALALALPGVGDLLAERAKLVQDYDGATGEKLGRFARHAVGFLMATERPLGIGPFVFPKLFIEETHNTYLKSVLEYGWLGLSAYLVLTAMTLFKGWSLAIRPRPWQGFAQCVMVCFTLHVLLNWIIDTDHWRHMYLMFGLAWGLIAAERLHGSAARTRLAAS